MSLETGLRHRRLPALRVSVPPHVRDRRNAGPPRPVARKEKKTMSHERDLADQDVEEVAEELWTLAEQGSDRLSDLRDTTQVAGLFDALKELARRGLVRLEDERVQLTPQGRELAARQVRRHRLAEALFTTVLEVHDDEAVNQTACVMEHVLSGGIADSICAFLGHPLICPHGKPIPPGACCRSFTRTVEPLVQPLDQLAVGEEGGVVF